jgi:5-methylthioadenosine/S-adenosylhomocysteine deaminase
MMPETLSADWLLTPGLPPQRGGRITFDRESGRILDVDTDVSSEEEGGTTIVTPGLINAHTHLELYSETPRALAEGETMADWILAVIAQSRQMDYAARKKACQQSIVELIRTGTTCVNDITSDGASLEALSLVGMRGIVSPEFFYPMHNEPWVREIAERVLELRERFKDDGLLAVGVSPHSPYNVTPAAYAKAMEDIPEPVVIHTHLAETRAETEWFETGASPLDQVHERVLGQRFGPVTPGTRPLSGLLPLLSKDWVAVHGVYLTEDEYRLLAQAGTSLVHCPRSNLTISGETIADLRAVMATGIALGLGTDSRYSASDLDLREEGRVAQRLHGLSVEEVLALMTAGSAAAIKHENLLGKLAPGYAVDLVVWHHPARDIADPYAAWLSPEAEVQLVRINGRTVLERCFSSFDAAGPG